MVYVAFIEQTWSERERKLCCNFIWIDLCQNVFDRLIISLVPVLYPLYVSYHIEGCSDTLWEPVNNKTIKFFPGHYSVV